MQGSVADIASGAMGTPTLQWLTASVKASHLHPQPIVKASHLHTQPSPPQAYTSPSPRAMTKEGKEQQNQQQHYYVRSAENGKGEETGNSPRGVGMHDFLLDASANRSINGAGAHSSRVPLIGGKEELKTYKGSLPLDGGMSTAALQGCGEGREGGRWGAATAPLPRSLSSDNPSAHTLSDPTSKQR